MALEFAPKTPYEELPWAFRFTKLLAGFPTGTTVDDADWTVEGEDELLIIGDTEIDDVKQLAVVNLSGGTVGQTYLLRCKMTLSTGDKPERDATITVIPVKPY